MSNVNGKILKKMLEQSYELQANDEAKEIYITNLRDFLCAGLATEKVPCIPKLKNGRMYLEYELENHTHECVGDLLSTALHSYEEKNRLYTLPNGHVATLMVNNNDSNAVHRVDEIRMEKEVFQEKTEEKYEEKKPVKKKPLEESKEPVEDLGEEKNEEINLIPTYKSIVLDHNVQEEDVLITWTGYTNDLKILEVEHDILEMDEEIAKIRIRNAQANDVIKIAFSEKIKDFQYEFIPVEEMPEEQSKDHSEACYFVHDQFAYVQYDISVEDIHAKETETNTIVILPLEKKEGPCKTMVVVLGEDGKNNIYTSPSGEETTIDYIQVGSHVFQIEAYYKKGEFTVDIYGRGETNNQNKYYISLEEKRKYVETDAEIGHPVLEVVEDGAGAIIHLFPLKMKWSEEEQLDIACVIEICDENGDQEVVTCCSEEFEDVSFMLAGVKKSILTQGTKDGIKVFVK